jgi:hypothetical protein
MSSQKRKHSTLTREERMTSDFTDTLYTNMWQFMNPSLLKDIMASYGCRMTVKRRKGVSPNGKVFPVSQRNSLCHESYGAGPDAEGHYYYIDKDGKAHGTYEDNLILKDIDDGICHGAALIYSLKACGLDLPDLISDPTNDKDLDHNYFTILSIYIDIIERGYWDKALKKHFENDSELTWDGDTTLQTRLALGTLKSYIKRFH